MRLPQMYRIGRLKVFPGRSRLLGCTHGPQAWLWWKIFSFHAAYVGGPLKLNHNIWLYTRWGAYVCQVVYDTRDYEKLGLK